ncbi:hypothetical protein G6F37_002735 [Rhizopus arrhizus]|nr:hypothetical protein G6F38_007232 [Rhizopus arrhizus]KAG1161811.1 hypothetical protein G6F37_002735 [Rhizopus arrhizus]
MKSSFLFSLVSLFCFVAASPVVMNTGVKAFSLPITSPPAATDAQNVSSFPGNQFQVTKPVEGAAYKLGDSAEVAWDHGVPGSLVINILHGNDPNNMNPTTWTAIYAASAGPGSYIIPITSFFDPKETYCFQLKFDQDGKSKTYYSHSFKITAN